MGVLGTERTPKHPSVAGTADCDTLLLDCLRGTRRDRKGTNDEVHRDRSAHRVRSRHAVRRVQPTAGVRPRGQRALRQATPAGEALAAPVPAVYALLQSAGTWKRQCKIAELSIDDAAIAGFAAAALHELPGFRPGRIELLVPVNSYCTHPFATMHRYAGAKLTIVDGIRVTTIPQTLFDIAPRVTAWRLERAMDDALLGKRTRVADLDERLAFYAGAAVRDFHGSGRSCSSAGATAWTPPGERAGGTAPAVLDRVPTPPKVVRQAAFPWRTTAAGTGRLPAARSSPDHRSRRSALARPARGLRPRPLARQRSGRQRLRRAALHVGPPPRARRRRPRCRQPHDRPANRRRLLTDGCLGDGSVP